MPSWTLRRALVGVAATVLAAAASWGGATAADAAGASGPHWATPAKATIKPGVSTVTIAGVKCVVGYLLTDGRRVFAAIPASCSGVSDGKPTNGCQEAQVPVGLKVKIRGARYKATLAYSAFTTMALRGVTAPNRCDHNDLTLLRLDRRDIRRANPSLPVVGGPTGVSRAKPAAPDQLTVVLGGAVTRAAADATNAGGWAHTMLISAPVNAAMIGSPTVTTSGAALGMVSLIPGNSPDSTVSDLYREIAYLHTVPGFAHVRLATGTAKFVAPGVL